MKMTDTDVKILVQAFFTPISELIQVDFNDTCLQHIQQANRILWGEADSYLHRGKLKPTLVNVCVIKSELEQASDSYAAVPRSILYRRIRACGPPLKAYIDYIDPDNRLTREWKDGWIPIVPSLVGPESHTLFEMRDLLHGPRRWPIQYPVSPPLTPLEKKEKKKKMKRLYKQTFLTNPIKYNSTQCLMPRPSPAL